MEIIDKTNRNGNGPASPRPRHLYPGIALIAVGAVWMLYNFEVVGHRFFDLFFSWQTLLVVIGGYLLSLGRWAWGGGVAAIGVFFLSIDLLGLHIPPDKVIWPSIFIVAGLAVLFPRMHKQ